MKFVDLSTRVRAPYSVRAAMAGRWLLLALILSASAASAQPSPVMIRGRIVADADHRPLRRAVVRIALDQSDREMRATLALARGQRPDREVRAVLTDEDGRFEIELPEPSSQLIVAKAGYTSIVVTPDRRAPTRELDIRLSRGAAVWGRVLERSGAPAVGARVVARRVEDPSDTTTTTTYEAETDDAGEYRIGSLPAGTYIMAAGSSLQGGPLIQGVNPSREVVQGIVSRRRLIFPGMTPGLAGATRFVEVRPGEEAGDVDFESTPDPLLVTPPRSAAFLEAAKIVDPPEGRIAGRVVTPLGQPVVNARVVITGNNRLSTTMTGANGRFDVWGLPDGDYRLEMTRFGFSSSLPGAPDQESTGVAHRLRIGGDTRVHDLELVLPPGGVVSGAVVDGAGEPFQGVLVRAFGLQNDGERTIATLATWPRLTDDRGRYRLFGLPRGSYLIVASIDAAEPAAGRSRAPGFAPVYYPGTAHVEGAQPVQVDLDGTLSGVDFAVTVTSTVRVAGTALNAAGNPPAGRVTLGVSHRSGSVAPEPRVVLVGPEGAFEFVDVPPGDYVVQVQAEPGPGTRAEFGAEYIAVGENDPPPMSIKTSVGATMEGRFVSESGSTMPMRAQSIHAAPMDIDRGPPGGRGPQGLAVHDDGRFYLTGLYGPMRLTYPTQAGWYLKSMTVGGVDVTDRPFDFGYTDEVFADAEIVISSAGATIAGSLTDGPRRGAPAFTVVAFSVDRATWFAGSRYLKRASSLSDGSFEVKDLPPGEYFVAAADTIGPGDWQTPNNLEALVQGATRVTVRESQTQAVTLRLVRR